jgi:hypothetical protein
MMRANSGQKRMKGRNWKIVFKRIASERKAWAGFLALHQSIVHTIIMRKALLLLWIVTCALIHLNALIPWLYGAQIGDNRQKGWHLDFWREFGKTDSRYLKNDNLIISLEGMMVFIDLPLCLIWLMLVFINSRSQLVLQLAVSCFQFFGTSMYFCGAYLRNWSDVDPTPSAFWGGFIFANAIWWVIPALLAIGAGAKISSELTAKTATEVKKKNN